MAEETAVTIVEAEPEKEAQALAIPTVHLVATDTQQMAAAQSQLVGWLYAKQAELDAEITELTTARDQARAKKWGTATFSSQLLKATKRKQFYGKLVLAAEAGYTIIPNLPIDLIAVKVDDREYGPSNTDMHDGWTRGPVPSDIVTEKAQQLVPAGQGDYVSPEPNVVRGRNRNEKQEITHWLRATSFKDMDFPVALAVPEIMDATAKAMALKVFDQIGICPAKGLRSRTQRTQLPPSRDPDPLIVGQILSPKHGYSGSRPVSFLIAWHLNLGTL
jgi:hypothetical protein